MNHPQEEDDRVHLAALMQDFPTNPVRDAVTFYQQFVCIHPFYDANGRIGRFITSLYLDYHGLHISWAGLSQNQQWLKNLTRHARDSI